LSPRLRQGNTVRRADWMLRCCVAAVLYGATAAAAAHDFWLQPSSFALAPGAEAGLALMVGDGGERRQSPIPARRIARFEAVAPDGTPAPLHGRAFRARCTGIHALVLQTDDAAQSHLPAGRFNAYLREEGLQAVIAHRERHRLQGDAGAERYSRVAKALLAVRGAANGGCAPSRGAGMAPEANAERAFGLPLELVLEPIQPKVGGVAERQGLGARVLYRGRPLPGSLVKLTDLARDEAPAATATADARGAVQFTLPYCGNWRLNVVWSEPAQRGDGIDYETIFSSLVFAGCPEGLWDNSARNEEQSPHRSLP
jgi:uncharacterized GH25 family protein